MNGWQLESDLLLPSVLVSPLVCVCVCAYLSFNRMCLRLCYLPIVLTGENIKLLNRACRHASFSPRPSQKASYALLPGGCIFASYLGRCSRQPSCQSRRLSSSIKSEIPALKAVTWVWPDLWDTSGTFQDDSCSQFLHLKVRRLKPSNT